MATAEWHELAPGVRLRVAQPACFIATKLEALADRGMADPILSQDLEDIVSVPMGLPWLASDIRLGEGAVHEFIRERMAELLASEDVLSAWQAHSGTDAPSQTIGRVARDEMLLASRSPSRLRRVRVQLESGDLAFSVPRISLAWSLQDDPTGDRLLAQGLVDGRFRAGESALLDGSRCWVLDPTDPQGERIPVTVASCECPACAKADGAEILPCAGCPDCLAEPVGTCEDCGLEARAFPETGEPPGIRARVGDLPTRCAACVVHDHVRCVRRWQFRNSGLTHVSSCRCSCREG